MRILGFIAVLAGLGWTSPVAAEAVGAATSLRPSATQAAPQQGAAELTLNANIFRDAELATGERGLLNVTFLDQSQLALGANSSVTVDEFNYAGPGAPGDQVLRYAKGAFRFISGAVPKDKVRIETPTVTIGIRGTTLRTLVAPDGTTTVGLDHGVAVVISRQTGLSITLNAGEKVTIKPGGEIGTITLGKVEGCP